MTTLLLRLAGPMQSWGTQSRFPHRDTGQEPSKSGVIGLLCAALGRPRWEPVGDLVALRMGVRVDREGAVKMDYQTAGGTHRQGERYGVARADASGMGTVLSWRYYLADASFLVGLELKGDDSLLHMLDGALTAPRWQIFLGRKSFVPGEPVRLLDVPPAGPGLRSEPLEEALRTYPWVPRDEAERKRPPERLRLVLDAATGEGTDVRADVPISFAERTFVTRAVHTDWVPRPKGEG